MENIIEATELSTDDLDTVAGGCYDYKKDDCYSEKKKHHHHHCKPRKEKCGGYSEDKYEGGYSSGGYGGYESY